MKNKKRLIVLSVFLILILAVAIISTVVYSNQLIDIENKESVLNAIVLAENNRTNVPEHKNVSADDVNSIEYYIAEEGNYSAVFYEYNNYNNIIILEESKIFPSKYKYFGGSSSSSSVGVYKYDENSKNNYLFITAISIRNMADYDKYKNIDKLRIQNVNQRTGEKTENFVEVVEKKPYFDLFIQEFSSDEDYSSECELSDSNEIIASY